MSVKYSSMVFNPNWMKMPKYPWQEQEKEKIHSPCFRHLFSNIGLICCGILRTKQLGKCVTMVMWIRFRFRYFASFHFISFMHSSATSRPTVTQLGENVEMYKHLLLTCAAIYDIAIAENNDIASNCRCICDMCERWKSLTIHSFWNIFQLLWNYTLGFYAIERT